MLKTLEEPPARAILFLISHAPGRLLPTIRSRCRRLDFNPLPSESLQHILKDNGFMLSPGDEKALITLCEGRPGYLLELAANDGLELYKRMIGLLESQPTLDQAALAKFADDIARKDSMTSWPYFCEFSAGLLHRLIQAMAGEVPFRPVLAGEDAVHTSLKAKHSLDSLLEVWDNMRTLHADGNRLNLDKKQVVISSMMAI